jgi:hypothetical protein
MTSDEAAAQAHGSTPAQPGTEPSLLLERRGVEMSVGARIWVMHIPSFIVGLFAHVEPGWPGSLGVAAGPEFVYRNNGLDIAIAVMYVGYGAPAGYFHGVNEGPNSTEQVTSSLFGVYLTSHFLWGIRFARQFEFQIGAGIGVGYIGGDLYRSQAYQSAPNVWADCQFPGTHPECGSDNNHYSRGQTPPAFTEPGIFSGGSVPTLIPWISLPQIGFHIRPHRNFDFKIEGGFALIGFYGGASLHYVF